MGKLTWYNNDGQIMCRRGYEVALARPASYEATSLTPERCAEFARADAEGRYIVMRDAEQEGGQNV